MAIPTKSSALKRRYYFEVLEEYTWIQASKFDGFNLHTVNHYFSPTTLLIHFVTNFPFTVI
jgi:hypothetical protein